MHLTCLEWETIVSEQNLMDLWTIKICWLFGSSYLTCFYSHFVNRTTLIDEKQNFDRGPCSMSWLKLSLCGTYVSFVTWEARMGLSRHLGINFVVLFNTGWNLSSEDVIVALSWRFACPSAVNVHGFMFIDFCFSGDINPAFWFYV